MYTEHAGNSVGDATGRRMVSTRPSLKEYCKPNPGRHAAVSPGQAATRHAPSLGHALGLLGCRALLCQAGAFLGHLPLAFTVDVLAALLHTCAHPAIACVLERPADLPY